MAFAPVLHPTFKRRLKDINPKYRAVWNGRREVWEIWDTSPAGANYIVVFARPLCGTYVPITTNKEPDIDLFTYLKRGEWLKNKTRADFMRYLWDCHYADEERQELIEKQDEYTNRCIAEEAHRTFQMFARHQGYDVSGKAKIPVAQGVDITPNGVDSNRLPYWRHT